MNISRKISGKSIFQSIWLEKDNRRYLLIALGATLLEFTIFKIFYPSPDFFSDSYSYIFAASTHLDINIWPIGYSKFLTIFHYLTHSDILLVSFQYIFLELACLYFFFTVVYLYEPSLTTKNTIFAFLFFNPIFLYIGNYINSDPLFASLSVLWLTELLWVINRPRLYQVFTQGVLLFFCFTVRNNAYYYPFIGTIVFVLSTQSLKHKLAGITFPLILIGLFVIHTRNEGEKLTGIKQFSLFTGWQLANNALYMYGHIQVDSTKLPSPDSRLLNTLSQNFYRHAAPDFDGLLADHGGNFFIQYPTAPLKQYLSLNYRFQDEFETVRAWGQASVVFAQYGKWLIKHYPLSFGRYFVLLNTRNYFLPSLEKLQVYNLGQNEVGQLAQDWFDYQTPTVDVVSKDIQGRILFIFPYLFLFMNILFIGCLFWLFISRNVYSLNKSLRQTLIVTTSLLLANFGFCVFATIIVMRYQFFPLIVVTVFSVLLLELIGKKEANPQMPPISLGLGINTPTNTEAIDQII